MESSLRHAQTRRLPGSGQVGGSGLGPGAGRPARTIARRRGAKAGSAGAIAARPGRTRSADLRDTSARIRRGRHRRAGWLHRDDRVSQAGPTQTSFAPLVSGRGRLIRGDYLMSEIRPAELPLELLEHIDAACDAFEQAWIGSGRPRVEDYLDSVPEDARSRLTAELIHLEMQQRWRHGEQPAVDEYRQRFPDCAESVAGWLDEARAAAERAASPEEETDDSRILPTLDGPPTMPPTIDSPSWLLGEYEVLERLGSGGIGEVYKARHRRLDKLVALKVLPADATHPCEATARFQREM